MQRYSYKLFNDIVEMYLTWEKISHLCSILQSEMA